MSIFFRTVDRESCGPNTYRTKPLMLMFLRWHHGSRVVPVIQDAFPILADHDVAQTYVAMEDATLESSFNSCQQQ